MPGELPTKILVQVTNPEPPFGGVVIQEFPEEFIIELASGPPSSPFTFSIITEVPTGDINGVNKDFVVSRDFSQIWVSKNGVRQSVENSDYTTSGRTITFMRAPEIGDFIIVDYVPS